MIVRVSPVSRSRTLSAFSSGFAIITWCRKWRPSGRNAGQPAPRSPLAASGVTSGLRTPPPASIIQSGSMPRPSNRITPRGLHEPSAPYCASPIVCAGPPATATRRSFPPAMNAIERLSGDQIGRSAPSVPGSEPRLERVERPQPDRLLPGRRRRRRMRACARRATAPAGRRPGRPRGSGSRSGRPGRAWARVAPTRRRSRPPRGRRERRSSRRGPRAHAAVSRRSRAGRRASRLPGSTASSAATSRALCQRSSGSFSRHLRTTWSSAGGDMRLHARDRRRLATRRSRRSGSCASCPRTRVVPWPSRRARAPEREDVGARVRRLPLELLRGHVLERADDRALLGERLSLRCGATTPPRTTPGPSPGRAARPKSRSLAPAARQHHVAGLQVAVHDPGAVGGVEGRARSGPRSAGRPSSGSGPFASRCASDSPSISSSTR